MNDNIKYLGLTSNKISRLENDYNKEVDMNKYTNIDNIKDSVFAKLFINDIKSKLNIINNKNDKDK